MNDLATIGQGRVAPIVPRNLDEVATLSKIVIQSGLAPKGMTRPEAAAIAIMTGMELGLNPMQSIQRIAVINGRPTVWGDAAIGLVRASGKLKSIKETVTGDGGDMAARCVVIRNDAPEDPIEGVFSLDDARRAGLLNKDGPWKQYTRRMLQMRARGYALRDGFADVLGGLYIGEEMQDVADTTPNLTPPDPDLISAPSAGDAAERAASVSSPEGPRETAPVSAPDSPPDAGSDTGDFFDPSEMSEQDQRVASDLGIDDDWWRE